jgi:hypothetical protein
MQTASHPQLKVEGRFSARFLVESGWKLSTERRTALQRSYHTLTPGQTDARKLAEFFSRHGQGLLPRVELIEQPRLAVDELIDVAGRATIEAVLQLSAEQVAGARMLGQLSRRLHFTLAGNVAAPEESMG